MTQEDKKINGAILNEFLKAKEEHEILRRKLGDFARNLDGISTVLHQLNSGRGSVESIELGKESLLILFKGANDFEAKQREIRLLEIPEIGILIKNFNRSLNRFKRSKEVLEELGIPLK